MARNRIIGGSLAIAVATANATTQHGYDVYYVKAAPAAPVTITLDPAPVNGDQYTIQDVLGNAGGQPIAIHASASFPLIGIGTGTTIDANYGAIEVTFSEALQGWSVTEFEGGSVPIPISGVYNFSTTVTVGMAVKLVSSDRVAPALADSAADVAFGMVTEVLTSSTCQVLIIGEAVVVPPLSDFTPAIPYYLSPTVPGGLQTSPPSTPGQVVQRIGFSKDATTFIVDIATPIVVAGAQLTAAVTTTAMTGGSGTAAYISGPATVAPTNASEPITPSGTPEARFVGFYEGVPGEIVIAGVIPDAQFVSGDGAPLNGAPVYLSATNPGLLTSVAPGVGNVIAEVGICDDAASFPTCVVIIQPKAPIQM